MADRDNARPEFNPRHRIVGAIVLVALVVIIVPMILSEREPPAELRDAPPAPARTEAAETRVIVTPVPPAEIKPAEVVEPAKQAVVSDSKPQTETKPAVAKKPEPAPVKAAPSAAPAKITDAWVVQVGTFSNTQNAERLRDKLKRLGYSVQSESVTLGGKKALRIRVGPFADRARADKAQAQIRKETGVAGVVQSSS